MELRQLHYFEAVARHRGFTRAAEQLHVAQPAVSAQVQKLERELGVVLFLRTTREVSLTPAGERLLERVRTVLHELDAARAEVEDYATAVRGTVRVGATPVVGSLPLSRLIGTFRAAHPAVQVSLRSGLVAGLLDRLDRGDLDLVVGPRHHEDSRFSAVPVGHETLVLITSPGAGVVERLRDVADLPFVCLARDSGLHHLLTGFAAREGFTPRIHVETDSPGSIRELVSAGVGVALVARSTAEGPGPAVRVHHLADTPEHPVICAMTSTRRAPSRAARVLHDVVVRGGSAG